MSYKVSAFAMTTNGQEFSVSGTLETVCVGVIGQLFLGPLMNYLELHVYDKETGTTVMSMKLHPQQDQFSCESALKAIRWYAEFKEEVENKNE
jgi:hypothetical protein